MIKYERKIMLLVMVTLVALAFTACGGGVKQGTMEDAAKNLVEGLIKGDEGILNQVNKSNAFEYPTHFLISNYASDFADYKLSDFEFAVEEEKKKVSFKSKDGKISKTAKIEKIGDKYCFIGF